MAWTEADLQAMQANLARGRGETEARKVLDRQRINIQFAFTIYGAPRSKKNSREHVKPKGTDRVIPLPSKAYRRWCATARFEPQFLAMCADRPWSLRATFYGDREDGDMPGTPTGDLDGFLAGLFDLLQAKGIVSNDKFIRRVDGTRLRVDRDNPRVEVTMTPVDDP